MRRQVGDGGGEVKDEERGGGRSKTGWYEGGEV